tara:strand:+ start:143 stop:310 length:168 start_codon:yes stop_codon:yes gene_type:complete
MPKVGGRQFEYTPKGISSAFAYATSKGLKVLFNGNGATRKRRRGKRKQRSKSKRY